MVIYMVTCKICEYSHRERASPQAVQRQRMRTGFKYRVRASRANDFGEVLLKIERFGRGSLARGETRPSRYFF